MADFTRSVELIFGGKDNVSPTIKNITRSLDGFESRVESLAAPVGDFADSVLKVDAAIVTLGAALIGFSVGEAIRFESAQLDLQKVLGDTEGDASDYADAIKDVSLTYGVLATDTTAAVANFKQASFSIEDSLTLVESSLIAVNIAELSADEASQLLTRTLIGFNLEAKDSVGILDTWNAASNRYNVSAGQLAEGLATGASAFDKFGLSIDESAALLTLIIERGASGSEAAKALRTGFLSLTQETQSTAQALEILGVEQLDSNGKMRSAVDILRDVQVAFQNVDEKQQPVIAGLIAGKEQALKLIPVFAGLNRESEIMAVLADKQGSAMTELAVRLGSTEVAINNLKTAFSNAQIAIGDEFKEGVKGSAVVLKELLIALEGVVDSGGLAPLFNLMQPLFEEFNKDVAAIAENLPEAFAGVDFSGLVSAFENLGSDLGNILTGLFGDFDIETVEGLEKVLQGTVDGLESLINVTRGIFIQLQPIFETIGQVIQSSGKIGEDTEIAFGRFLGAGKLINDFGGTMGIALNIIRETGTNIVNVFDTLIGAGKVVINVLQAAFDELAGEIIRVAVIANEALAFFTTGDLSEGFKQDAEELRLLGQGIEENLRRNASEIEQGFIQMGQGLGVVARDVDTETTKISKSVASITDETVQSQTALNEAGLSLEQVFKNAGQAIDPVTGAVTSLAVETDKAATSTTIAKEKTSEWVVSLVDGVQTFTQTGGAIKDAYGEVSEGAEEATKKTDEFLVKMEEIASNERIKTVEAVVELNIAALESDAKIAVSIIEGLGESIQATAGLIGSLFGNLTSVEDRSDQLAIRRQIELENKNRESELALQKGLVEAQIDNINAKTDALRNGDGLITIQSDGLEVELEQFMMAVLRRVQVKAAEDQSLFLLGLPAVA